MKIGIIVYSNTGHTLSVAKELEKKLKTKHEVELKEVKGNRKGNVVLTNTPSIEKYDYIIFASFVEAFQLNEVMKKYLKELDLKNKRISAFVTEAFSKPWLGGNNAIKQINKIVNLEKSGIINWNNKKREEQITNLINDFSNIK